MTCSWCLDVHNIKQGRPTSKGFISGSKNYRQLNLSQTEAETVEEINEDRGVKVPV